MMRLLIVVGLALLAWPRTDAAIAVTASARSMQPGELVMLTIALPSEATAPHVRAFDRDALPFAAGAGTWRVLVGIDLDVTPGRYLVDIDAGAAPALRTHYPLTVTAKHFTTRTLTVDDAFVNPPASVTARIQSEAALLDHTWKSSSSVKEWDGAFVRPVAEEANSAFGSRSVFNGQARSAHGGADFLSPAGTPIKAPNAGRVVIAHALYYTGNTVVIDHGLGLFSLFAHLSETDVHEGDRVTTGQVLGLVGATGRVTGPHLHWAVRCGGARIDPLSLLATLGAAQ